MGWQEEELQELRRLYENVKKTNENLKEQVNNLKEEKGKLLAEIEVLRERLLEASKK